jgi:plasmid stabilization system protein ParE
MTFEIIWTRNAICHFDEIINFLLLTWNEEIAQSFIDLVENELLFIKSNPKCYPMFDEFRNIRKVVVHKNVSLFYRLNENKIELISFWDNRQNPNKLII